jgi:hypothetical protein
MKTKLNKFGLTELAVWEKLGGMCETGANCRLSEKCSIKK